ARRRQAPSRRANAAVGFVLCNIEADNSRLLWHPPFPSLLVRALTPMQLFGFKEDAGPVPRSPTGSAFGVYGLRSGDGRLLQQPPVRRLCHVSRTQGARVRGPPMAAPFACAPDGETPRPAFRAAFSRYR